MCCCQTTVTVGVLVTGQAGDRPGSADLGPHVGPGPDPDDPAFHICWHLVVKLRVTLPSANVRIKDEKQTFWEVVDAPVTC